MVAPYIAYDGPVVSRQEALAAGTKRFFTGRPCKRSHLAERFTLNVTCARCCVEQHDDRRDRINEQARQRRLDDPEKYRAMDKAERLANPEANRAKTLKWRAANQERHTAMCKAWKQRNTATVKEYSARRYAENSEDARGYAKAYRAANLVLVKAKKAAKYAASPERDRAYSRAWHAANLDVAKSMHRAWLRANPDKSREYEARRRALKQQAGGDHTADDVRRIGDAQKWKCHWCSKPTKQKYHVDHIVPLSRGGGNGPDNLAITCVSCNQRKWAMDPIEFAQRMGLLI